MIRALLIIVIFSYPATVKSERWVGLISSVVSLEASKSTDKPNKTTGETCPVGGCEETVGATTLGKKVVSPPVFKGRLLQRFQFRR